ncbi:PstS family phosphate ABC transporter substrate-binding protein [Halolamina salifodinae]|uniref:Phosphate transport system substrate-binding protein n=1 Tax=Halolamina salifodinae TaxID=1202767 RepID=A0A8T4GXB6_9EURY|nr:PstS family phosphate ABC transporter substrate-binding protein [Halolamina salifodinae]MBP1987596.1 phosphate transport system substrate-binding protein [Halolamina salifodinae]
MAKKTNGVSRRSFMAGVATTGAVAAAGCTSNTGTETASGLSGNIDISGSSTVFPLAVAMRGEFTAEEMHPNVDISINSTGSGGGFTNYFCTGDTDFNNASRPISETEQEQCTNNDVTPVELKVATDALTVVVNNDASWFGEDGEECITVEDLAEVWAADSKPTTWSDVNSDWPDEEIQLYGPTDASGTFDYFHEEILGEETGHRTDYQSTEQDNQIINGVANSEYAIGYMGFAYYSENTDRVTALGIDNGDGCVKPTLETASSGEYQPLSRPLFTYPARSALAEDHVAEFARFWLENSTNKAIVADEVGYVPNTEAERDENLDRLDSAIEAESE